ncbi:hypothetical protein [Erysipelothrix aquatica]|uniref:hypothetical protein n=1 Tax=Erysipelothrix aquatica TaxID=2683714 RepID=UPI00135A54A0|nr:hypothetical protein [Erysipelothrix aquatica]
MKKNKKIKTLNDFLEIETIAQDHVVLKDSTILAGLKIEPKDLLVASDDEARLVLSRLKNAGDAMNFEVDWGFVFVPNNYSFIENPLREQYYDPETSLEQQLIIEADLQKLAAQSRNQYKLEFHVTIQGSEDLVMRNLEKMMDELKRALPCSVLKEQDYLNAINYYFDVDNYQLTFSAYKGEQLS